MRDYEQRLLPVCVHPWLTAAQSIPAGRLMLIWSLIQVTSTWFHSPFAGLNADLFLAPLASQPVVEAFCKIPAWYHFKGGQNGAVARTAFGPRLSDEVLSRGTSKGTPDLWIRDLLTRNRNFLRELLLDGFLVREQILDRAKLEAALDTGVHRTRISAAEIVMQVYVECWIRNWVAVSRAAAA